MKRYISIILVSCMIVFCYIPAVSVDANPLQEDKESNKVTYIIECDSRKQYQEIKREFTEDNQIMVKHKLSDEKLLEESKSIVVCLSDEEKKEYKSKYDIEVDKELKACTYDNKCVPIEVPNRIAEKTIEYSDNPKDFKPCNSIIDKREIKEEVPWNISCVSKESYKDKHRGKK